MPENLLAATHPTWETFMLSTTGDQISLTTLSHIVRYFRSSKKMNIPKPNGCSTLCFTLTSIGKAIKTKTMMSIVEFLKGSYLKMKLRCQKQTFATSLLHYQGKEILDFCGFFCLNPKNLKI